MPPRHVPHRGARVAASLWSSRTRGSLWTPARKSMEVRAMPYEKVVLTDGMAVLFAVPEEPQETGPSEVETPQSDPRVLVAALTAASRVIAAGQVRRRQETA